MGKSSPDIPDPALGAIAGIQQDQALQPFKYLIQAASTMGRPVRIGGRTYDFRGLGNMDTARVVSDQMAQTLLDLQKEKSPEIIQQRINELKAADPEGYAARQQLFDRIIADARENPNRPVAEALQRNLQNELAKGSGFDDAKQEQEVRDSARGAQVMRGIYLGNAPTSQEAKTVLQTGEQLRNQREQNALNLLESGASPEDVAYRRMQQNIGNLGAFAAGQTPESQFQQVSASGRGPVNLTGQSPNPGGLFDPNAAAFGVGQQSSMYGSMLGYQGSQANPWLAGLSNAATGFGALANIYGARSPAYSGGYTAGSYAGTGDQSPENAAWP